MSRRPSLLVLTAGIAAMAAVANGVSAASPAPSASPPTRLGASIDQELGARDREAMRRKRELDLREQAAKATEARLKAQLGGGQQSGPAAPVAAKSDEPDQFEELARIYQAMKPAKAAVIFEQLAMDVQMKIAQRMRERSTAMILASMTPNGASALSMALARRQALAPRASERSAPATK